jgi:hypothetical protein
VRKKHVILFLFVIIILALSHRLHAEDNLKLEINLSKVSYLEGEPIWLDCWLTNVGEDTLRTWGLCLQCFWGPKVLLMNSSGDTLPYTGPHWEVVPKPGTIPGFILQPQESDYDCYDLAESFEQKPSLHSFYLSTLQPGRYKVKALYREAESDELEFEVIPPEGKEVEAYKLLKDALNAFISRNDSLELASLTELVAKYPNSVYSQQAYRLLWEWEEMLEKHPNSGFAENAIRNLTGETSGLSEQEKKEFLRRIIRTHPKTRAAWFAKDKLQAINRRD